MKTTKQPKGKRLYEMGPIDTMKLIKYPAPSLSMLDGWKAYLQSEKGKK